MIRRLLEFKKNYYQAPVGQFTFLSPLSEQTRVPLLLYIRASLYLSLVRVTTGVPSDSSVVVDGYRSGDGMQGRVRVRSESGTRMRVVATNPRWWGAAAQFCSSSGLCAARMMLLLEVVAMSERGSMQIDRKRGMTGDYEEFRSMEGLMLRFENCLDMDMENRPGHNVQGVPCLKCV
ncbi:hypothetical protein RYX36_031753 [Vicia faba]